MVQKPSMFGGATLCGEQPSIPPVMPYGQRPARASWHPEKLYRCSGPVPPGHHLDADSGVSGGAGASASISRITFSGSLTPPGASTPLAAATFSSACKREINWYSRFLPVGRSDSFRFLPGSFRLGAPFWFWGELANKMGTVVEDIVAPSVRRLAREVFECAACHIAEEQRP